MSTHGDSYSARRRQRSSPRPLIFLACVLVTVVGVPFIVFMLFFESTVEPGGSGRDYTCSAVTAPTVASHYGDKPRVRDVICGHARTRRLAWAGIAGFVTVGCAIGARRLAPEPMFGGRPNG